MSDRYDALKLKNQLCFPLYACSKEIVKAYKPYLDELDLIVTITDSGEALKEKAASVPERLAACIELDPQKAQALYALLYEVLGKLT